MKEFLLVFRSVWAGRLPLRQVRIADAGRDGVDVYGSGDDYSASIGTGASEQSFRFVNSIQ
jgi:hypothetical protein